MRRLFMYELKKLVCRRMVWVSMVVSLLLCLFTVCSPLIGSYYVNGERIGSNYEQFQIDKAYQEALDGRRIDEALIRQMQEAYAQVPMDVEQYSLTEEYQKYARPYSAIFHYVRLAADLSGEEVIQWVANMEDLHDKRLESQEKRWESFGLTEEEKVFWREQEEKLERLVTYQYTEGYSVLVSAVYTVGLVAIFVASVCLSGVFAEEHARKTDQLILSSKCGRKEVFRAKVGAGVLLAFGIALAMVVVTIVSALCVYGTGGFDAAFQLEYSASSCPISVGEAVVIAYGMVLFATAFMGALVMMLSEVLRNGVAVLAIATGVIILPMFISMPEEYRVLSQLWSYLPSDFVAVWSSFSPQTVVIGTVVLQAWQFVPILYTVLGSVFIFVCKRAYKKYQVNGR